jgi:N utilization substance protein A
MNLREIVGGVAERAGASAEQLEGLVLESIRAAAAATWPTHGERFETSWDAGGAVELKLYRTIGKDLALDDARRCGLDDPADPLQDGDELGFTVFYRPDQDSARELQRTKFGSLLPIEQPEQFGRRAAAAAARALTKLVEVHRATTLRASFEELVGRVVIGRARRHERGALFVDLGGVEARLGAGAGGSEYGTGDRVVALVEAVRGREIVLTRHGAAFVRALVALEVPAVESGQVEVAGVARDRSRVKIAVRGREGSGVTPADAVELVVGERGAHVLELTRVLGGAQVDVVPWDDDPVRGAIAALSGVEVLDVEVLDDRDDDAPAEAPDVGSSRITVVVAPEDVRAAVGARGANARLAAVLHGWRELVVRGGESSGSDASCASSSETTMQDEEG